MFRATTAAPFLPLFVMLPSCSLLIDTNPDGVINAGGTGGIKQGAAGYSNHRSDAGGTGGGVGSSKNPTATTGPSNGGFSGVSSGMASAGGTASNGAIGGSGPTASLVGGADAGGASQVVGGANAIGGASVASSILSPGGTSGVGGTTISSLATGGHAAGGTSSTGGTTIADTGPCTAGTLKCIGNVPQLCSSSGVWQAQTTCSGPTPTCSAGACVCSAGSKQCKSDGATPQFCNASGVWQDQTACSGSTPACNGEGLCGECKAGAKKCEGAVPYLCSSAGVWQAQTACGGSKPFCSAGACTATCPGNGGPAMKLLPEGYCIDTTEVTREQYYTWIASNPVANAASQIAECAWNGSYVPGTDASNDWPPSGNLKAPVVFIDWCDAYAFCLAVGKRLCGKIGGNYISHDELNKNPNSSQWTNACSSHGANDYTYGDTFVEGACNVNSSKTMYVGSLSQCQPPTATYGGVYDLSANAEEWEDNCTQGEGMEAGCLTRGGSFPFWNEYSMCASTYSVNRSTSSNSIGFRCCTQ